MLCPLFSAGKRLSQIPRVVLTALADSSRHQRSEVTTPLRDDEHWTGCLVQKRGHDPAQAVVPRVSAGSDKNSRV
jgi:hypothetical protein